MSFTSQAFLNPSGLSHTCARTCPARSSRSRIHRCQPLCASGSCRQATTPASTSFSALRTSSFALRKPAGSPAPARATTVTAPGAPRARLEIKRNSVGPGASARRLYAGARARHNRDGSGRAKGAADFTHLLMFYAKTQWNVVITQTITFVVNVKSRSAARSERSSMHANECISAALRLMPSALRFRISRCI